MSVFYKFRDEFRYMLNAPDRETGDEMVYYELGMSHDFIETLNLIKSQTSRKERDDLLRKYMFGKHEKFAPELAEVMETLEISVGNVILDDLLVKMERYIETLNAIKDAPTRQDGDKIIEAALLK